jgi:hypothetical protein
MNYCLMFQSVARKTLDDSSAIFKSKHGSFDVGPVTEYVRDRAAACWSYNSGLRVREDILGPSPPAEMLSLLHSGSEAPWKDLARDADFDVSIVKPDKGLSLTLVKETCGQDWWTS